MRGTSFRLLLTTILLLGAVPGAIANAGDADAERTGTESAALYLAADNQPYVKLDMETLADLPNAKALDGRTSFSDWALSDDGSTLVNIDDQSTVVVRDGRSGVERFRFQPSLAVFGAQLSRDGTRLVASISRSCGVSGCSQPVWHVFDTSNGDQLTTIEGGGQDGGPTGLIDPAGWRLYRPFVEPNQSDGPWPLVIAAYDLETGAEIARLSLPEIHAGTWYVESIDQVPISDMLMPAMALSPDGTRLAILHADADMMTLIDTKMLTVEETLTLTRPEEFGHRLLRWLGVAPETAEAKYMDGRRLEAVFAPDGRHLYLYGSEGEAGDGAPEPTERGLGLTLIDVATGEIVAEALEDAPLVQVLPTPDGRDLYVNGPTIPWTATSGEPSYRLYRLDAQSLETLAEREFPSRRWIALVPADS